MEVPLNILHNYIGLPVMAGLAFETLRRNRTTNNTTGILLGLASLFGAFATAALGIPVLFTQDPTLLSIGTLFGDLFLTILFLIMWIISIRAFLANHPKIVPIAQAAVVALTIACIVEAFHRNIFLSPSTEVIQSNGGIALVYKDSILYQVLSGLDSVALLFMSTYFWRQGKDVVKTSQRIRIRSVALGFTLGALGFILVAAFPVEYQVNVTGAFMGTGFGVLVLGYVLSQRAKRKETIPS